MWRMLQGQPGLRIRYTVFNKANADEFKGDCPSGVDVGTMHSFGFAACRSAFRSEVERNKTYLALDEGYAGRSLPRYLRKSIQQLVSQAKNQGLDAPPAESDGAFEDYLGRLDELLLHYDIRAYGQPGRVCEWAARVLRRSAKWTEVVDFDDMLWLPFVHRLEFPGADCVFLDEAQDLNPTQHALVPRLAGGGRVVAVGDRFQSIYGFRGADCASLATLEQQLAGHPVRGFCRLPLTVTFRCPKSHVALANAYVPDLTAHEGNRDGVIEPGKTLDDLLAGVRPGDRVLAYQNAPVVSAALKLIAERRRAFVRGRALGEQLLAVVRGCGEPRTVAELAKAVCQWKARELAHLEDLDGVEDVVESVNDRAAGLMAICSACDSPAEVAPLIGDLFTEHDQGGAVNCSTVHRAKGLEAETVWLIDTPMRPPKRPWEAQQQANLRYVGLTRSKNRLVFVDPEVS
jgi:DNA helicase-2/ATP-dependent DNA helicase PcrA